MTAGQPSRIAVVGAACRVPGADNPRQFWDLLIQGRDACGEIPAELYDKERYYDTVNSTRNKMAARTGNFLGDIIRMMDVDFFGFTKEEAAQLDPQHRLALMCTYEALELAGWSPDAKKDADTGVFFGVTCDDYKENLMSDISHGFATGTSREMLSQRIARTFGFGGAALTVDTVCSSSLVGLDIACTQLQSGKHSTAIVGGANILTQPQVSIGLDKSHFLSRTGQCKTLDKGADGYSRADAVNVLVIKRLEDAIRDKDKIYAEILATGTNHSGEAHSITHPHSPAQIDLMKRVLYEANVEPRDVKVVEAHGTGTQAGDLNELTAIRDVFVVPGRREGDSVIFTTSKANVGHSEASSGLTAAIKMLLMFSHGKVPPHIGIRDALNPTLTHLLQDGQIAVAGSDALDLPDGDLIGCVNNFGASGGNTCAIFRRHCSLPRAEIQKGEKLPLTDAVSCKWPFIISARSNRSLELNRKAIAKHLDSLSSGQEVTLQDLSYSSTARRPSHQFRDVHFVSTIAELKESIVNSFNQPARELKNGTSAVTVNVLGSVEEQTLAIHWLQKRLTKSRRAIDKCFYTLDSMGKASTVSQIRSATVQDHQQYLSFTLLHAIATFFLDINIPLHAETSGTDSFQLALRAVKQEESLFSVLQRLEHYQEASNKNNTVKSETNRTILVLDLRSKCIEEAILQALSDATAVGISLDWKTVHEAVSPSARLVKIPNYVWDLQDCFVTFKDSCLITPSWSDNPVRVGPNPGPGSASQKQVRHLHPHSDLTLETLQPGASFRLAVHGCASLSSYLTTLGSQKHVLLTELLSDAFSSAFAIEPQEVHIFTDISCDSLTHVDLHRRSFNTVEVECHEGTRIAKIIFGKDMADSAPQNATKSLIELHCKSIIAASSLSRIHSNLIYSVIQQSYIEVRRNLKSAKFSLDGTTAVFTARPDRYEDIRISLLAAATQALTFLVCKGQQDRQGICLVARYYRLQGILPSAQTNALLLYTLLTGEFSGQVHCIDKATGKVMCSYWDVELCQTASVIDKRKPSLQGIANQADSGTSIIEVTQDRKVSMSNEVAGRSGTSRVKTESHRGLSGVSQIIAAEVGIEEHDLDKQNVSFSDLGIDSLMSLTILGRLREEYPNIELPGSLFIDYGCWADLKTFLLRHSHEDNEPASAEDCEVQTNSSLSSDASSHTLHTNMTSPDLADKKQDVEIDTKWTSDVFLDAAIEIICDEMGIDRGSLLAAASFADIGIDSLMSLNLLDRLRQISPVELPGSLFIDCETVQELKSFFTSQSDTKEVLSPTRQSLEPNSTDLQDADEQPANTAHSDVPSVQYADIDDPSAKAVLLCGSPKQAEKERALFLIPDGSGSPAVFQHVKDMGRCVYGLSSPFLLPRWKDSWHGGVSEIAHHYIRQIRAKQSHGPYMLGGWSFGGVTSFEVAIQLIEQGEKVQSIVLLDAPCPKKMPALPHTIIDWALKSEALSGLGIKRFSDTMAKHFRGAISTLDQYDPPTLDDVIKRQGGRNDSLAPSNVLLVTPVGGIDADPAEVKDSNSCVDWMFGKRQGLGAHGWDTLFGQTTTVKVAEIGGNHFTMMNTPYSDEWLAIVRRWIRDQVKPDVMSG